MRAKEHYDNHLASFYAWMAGDFDTAKLSFESWLKQKQISPASTKVAIDLGAGHGIQTATLASLGFQVTAIDFSKHLLNELSTNCTDNKVAIQIDDIRNVANYKHLNPELIICWGDTLTHLETNQDAEQLLKACFDTLIIDGLLLLSFRNYSEALIGNQRFIPVKSDENRILTCVLDYEDEYVTVTDLLHQKQAGKWEQYVSSYKKLRLDVQKVLHLLTGMGMQIITHEQFNRMETIVALKPTSVI